MSHPQTSLLNGEITVALKTLVTAVGMVFLAGIYLGFYASLELAARRDRPVDYK